MSGVAIHLVNEGESGEMVGIGLTPNGLRLRLHSCDGVEQHHGRVHCAQAGVDLEGEVEMTGRVDQEEIVAPPGKIGGGGGYCYAATALLWLVVERCGSDVDAAHAREVAGVEEHCF